MAQLGCLSKSVGKEKMLSPGQQLDRVCHYIPSEIEVLGDLFEFGDT